MEANKIQQKDKHPRNSANPISVLFFSWLFPLFWQGWKKDLDIEDLYKPLTEHKSEILGDLMETLWQEEVALSNLQRKNPKLFRVIWRIFGTSIILQGVLVFLVEFILRLAQPYLMGSLIDSFSKRESLTNPQLQYYAAGLIVTIFLTALLMHFYQMNVVHIGMKIRLATSSLIYRKVLKLSSSRNIDTSTGKIINLLANDAMRFDYAITFLHDLWIGPIQIVIVYYFLWNLIGYSSLVGLIPVLVFMVLHSCLGKAISSLRRKTVLKTDERINNTSEIIKGINVIKMHAWELTVTKMVSKLRKKEIAIFKKLSYVRGIMNSFPMFHTRLTTTLTIMVYVLLGNCITSKKVFVLTSYLNILQNSVATYFPEGISQMSEFFVSVRRIEDYLLSNENTPLPIAPKSEIIQHHDHEGVFNNLIPHLRLIDVYAKWSSDQADCVLNDCSISLYPGKVYALTGMVGSGKTAIFQAILGEIEITSGLIDIEGTISYAAQEPWLFPGTIRQNIVFDNEYDPVRYNTVLQACTLDVDLQNMKYRDQTYCGGKGISLSTGQKARINLARCVYKEADIYLLDDTFASLDLNVSRHIYRYCIKDLLKDKIVAVISHQLQYLDSDDNVIVIDQGKVKHQGLKKTLQHTDTEDLQIFCREDLKDQSETELRRRRHSSVQGSTASLERIRRQDSLTVARCHRHNFSLYQSYLKAGYGPCMVLLTAAMFLMPQLFGSCSDYWLSFWVDMEENNYFTNSTTEYNFIIPKPTREICIIVFGSLVGATILASLVRSLIYYAACMKASLNLHKKMLKSTVRAPAYFFSFTPAGSILTRFSKDIGIIDENLPSALHDFLQITLMAIGIVVVVPTTNPWIVIPSAVAFVVFYILRLIYISTSNSLRKLEGSARSPVITHLTTTLQGLITARAFKAQKHLVRQFDHHQDIHSSTWYIYLAVNRAFAMWLDMICVIYNAVITLLFVYVSKTSTGADVGLALTQASGLTGILQWGVRQSAEVGNNMVSVRRILEYTKLEQEPSLHSKGVQVLDGWPQRGAIDFVNVNMRYDPKGQNILKNINLSILPTQKVGIVGRTGSGKSSLIAALFRLGEIEGTIKIDGIDISMLGLHDFRSKITVITQEPFLFAGPLRKCLDYHDEHSDEELWQALEEVNLKEFIKSLNNGLYTQITEGGSNISVGQRQLLCLARAIIYQNRIIVLDESTANIDLETDSIIQKTLKTKFESCTVITIAHRILTVMDSDIMIVMDSGEILEIGHPFILLQNEDGFLQQLLQRNGELAEQMFSIAMKSYEDTLSPIHDCTV